MAKKDKKDKKKDKDKKDSGAADALEAIRSAVERTFQATAEGAAGTQKRTQNLVDEIAGAVARVRDTIEELKVLDDVRGLRTEIAALSARVSALESAVKGRGGRAKPATARPCRVLARQDGHRGDRQEGRRHRRARRPHAPPARRSPPRPARPRRRRRSPGSGSS